MRVDVDKSGADDLPAGLNDRSRRAIGRLPQDLDAVILYAKIGLKTWGAAPIDDGGFSNDQIHCRSSIGSRAALSTVFPFLGKSYSRKRVIP